MSEKKVKRKVVSTQIDKGTPSVAVTATDTFLLEEAEAQNRKSHEDLELFRQTSAEIRGHLDEISKLKASPDNEAKIEKERIQICLHFLLLKKLNRLDKHRIKHAKDSVAEAKQKVDSYNLQLQNLQYEVLHLQREASKCLDFRSKDEDMDLVPLEEFYKEAPPSISRPEVCRQDPHQENLARLQWELTQRKKLAEKCTKMEARKKLLQQDIAKKMEKSGKIYPTLLNIIEAAKPLHTELGMPLQATSVEHEGANLLPGPLYNLYVNVHAYRAAASPGQEPVLTATIEGSQEEAKTLVASPSPSEEDSGAETDQEESMGPSGDGHRRRERASEKENVILASHPMTVRVTVGSSQDEDLVLTLEFGYLLHLHVVAVRVVEVSPPVAGVASGDVLQGDKFLHHLLPGKAPDDGSHSPNPSNNYLLRKYGLSPASVWGSLCGLPYHWAQHLGGRSFLKRGEEPEEKSKEEVVSDIFHGLQQRVQARARLYQQLHSLERGLVPLAPGLASHFPTKVVSRLHSWLPATWAQLLQVHKGAEEDWQDILCPQDFVYKLILERGSAQLHAYVVIPLDYPVHTPVFLLSLHWRSRHITHTDWALWELEQQVNLVEGGDLGYQVQTLAVGLDLYLEIQEDCAVEGPKEFPLSQTMLRRTLGPGRIPPYKYLPKLGLFTH